MATLSSSFLPNSSLRLSLTTNVNKTTNFSSFTIVAQKKVKKIRKILLKEDIEHVGKKGELKNVRAGYFRNYLLPLGKAQLITPAVINGFVPDIYFCVREMKMEEERIEAEKIRVKEEALLLAQLFETYGSFKVKRKGGKGKQIFGTVTARDFVDIVKAQLQREVDMNDVFMPEIREAGEYMVELKLHPEVSAQVRLSVYAN